MKAFIKRKRAKKIDEGKLAKAVGRSQRSMDNFRRFMALSANKQQMATVTDQMFSAFMLHNLLGTEEQAVYRSMPENGEKTHRLPRKAPVVDAYHSLLGGAFARSAGL